MQIELSSMENNFESLTIKRNGADTYNLYGLMWWTFVRDGKKTKSLVSVKSDNLKWNYQMSYSQECEYDYIKNGNGSTLGSFLRYATRQALHNFSFYNVMSEDVLVTVTILNEGEDGLMKYNIYEGLESYIVKINVAGVRKEEIKVILEDGIIKVRTSPKIEKMEDADAKLEMFEPVKGDTEIYLPNVESVEAKLEDGILTLVAPKQSKGVRIDIQ